MVCVMERRIGLQSRAFLTLVEWGYETTNGDNESGICCKQRILMQIPVYEWAQYAVRGPTVVVRVGFHCLDGTSSQL